MTRRPGAHLRAATRRTGARCGLRAARALGPTPRALILPDDLYRDVKRLAADQGRTVTSVVEEALRAALARHHAGVPATPRTYRVQPTGDGGLRPGVDLTDSAALLEVMADR